MPTEQLELRNYIFSSDEFRKLSEPEQQFFVRLALISDDLRHLHYLILHARVAMNATANDIEKVMALHQLMFALRIYYGTLNESWEVVRTGRFATKLSQTMTNSLSEEAQEALAALKRYFEHDNFAWRIRNTLAFHFPDEPIKEALNYRPPDKQDGFVAGRNLANIFYMFAENIRLRAILLKAGVQHINDLDEVRSGVWKIYEEGLSVSDHFTAFANAVMVEIAKKLNLKVEIFSTPSVTDFTTLTPILFVDAESIRKLDQGP
jgi:hypothetical protein